ncbi:MAG: AAA family ATPase [Lyngbya sp.]|nr:AAA family ATPase [Lyngbya sp.]
MTDSSLPILIEQMLQPSFYPHPVTEPIELVQTHISFILLTGDYSYKVKKSVNLGFLDFSIIQKRQHFCQEELRLNKPLAPEFYLEVLPISKVGDRFQLSDDSHPVEYTLKMRQFPQDNLLINLFKAGKITFEDLGKLGKKVADFHLNAPTNDYIRQFGKIAKVRQAIEQNYEQTDQYIDIAQTQEQYDETRQFTDKFLQEHESLFQSRIEKNWIRECHGDLHLKNMFFWQNEVMLFDRIEFNEEFRFVDVMYDVAFIVMDLDGRERSDLSNEFLNSYIEQTGDWEGLQILPFYLCRQAYVRAKVNSMMLDEPEISDDKKQEIQQEAGLYYQLAWKYTRQKLGRILIMSGLSGSGKSTVARQLARRINGIQIRSDAVRKHLGGIGLNERGTEELYTEEMTQKTYERLLELGLILASQGFTVILDAKYDRLQLREKVIKECESHQLPLNILQCVAPVEVLRSRLESRSGDITDATVDLLESQQQQAEPFTQQEKAYVTSINTTQDVEKQLEKFSN